MVLFFVSLCLVFSRPALKLLNDIADQPQNQPNPKGKRKALSSSVAIAPLWLHLPPRFAAFFLFVFRPALKLIDYSADCKAFLFG